MHMKIKVVNKKSGVEINTYFLASILASESASCIPFFIVSANTDICLDI